MHLLNRIFRPAGLTATLAAVCLVTTAFAVDPIGVTADTLRLRDQASAASSVLATAPVDASVTVSNSIDGWFPVVYNGTSDFMSVQYITVPDEIIADAAVPTAASDSTAESAAAPASDSTAESTAVPASDSTAESTAVPASDSTAGTTAAPVSESVPVSVPTPASVPTYVKAATTVNIRSGAGTNFDKIGSMSYGAIGDLLATVDGWYQVSYHGITGYVSADYTTLTDTNTTSLREELVAYAMQFKGCSYVYGSSGPNSFDCSGLTKYVYQHFGYTLSRSASDQYNNGTAISKSELQIGDLVLFNSGNSYKAATHVGIYIGGGEFIHASSSSTGVVISSLNSNYYTGVYVGARSIL